MQNKIMVETSARHLHVTDEVLATLFGEGHQLTNKKDLSQPGQFACEEKVVVVGPKGSLKMSILGPTRPDTQVEVSYTDARALGLRPPVKESGDIEGTPGVTLQGPCGEVTIDKGVMVAKRHIHMTPEEAAAAGVADKEIVSVRVDGERSVVFNEVVVRVSPKFAAAMHIDTDEANAAGLAGAVTGEILK